MFTLSCLRSCCVVATIMALSACSIIHPEVPIPQTTSIQSSVGAPTQVGTQANEQLSYDDVVKIARNTESDMQQRVSDLDDFDFWSGAGLLTAGIAGTAIGVYGGSQNSAIAVALAGGTILGARAYVPTTVRRAIYTQGIAAIECSIVATQLGSPIPLPSNSPNGNPANISTDTQSAVGQPASSGSAGLAGVSASLAGSLTQNSSVSGSLASAQVQLIQPAGPLSAVGALASVKAAELAAAVQQTNDTVNTAIAAAQAAETNGPQRLMGAVVAVAIAVNSQLAENSLNPTQALTAAEQGVVSLKKNAADAASQALAAVNKQQQTAQDTASVAKQTADAAETQQQPALQSAAANLQATAQNAQDIATQIKPILTQILTSVNVPTSCFGGLLGS